MCEKISYDTNREAIVHVKSLIKRKGGKYRTYTCDDCGCIHVTTVRRIWKMKDEKYKKDELKSKDTPHEFKQRDVIGIPKQSKIIKMLETTYRPFADMKL